MSPHPSSIVLLTLVASLAAQENSKDPMESAWNAALAAAKQQKAPLLVFVVPDRDGPADPKRAVACREAENAAGMLTGHKAPEPGVPAIATQQDLLLRQVQLLRASAMFDARRRGPQGEPGELTDVHRIWTLTVPAVARAKTCGAKPGETVVLLRADGKLMRGFEVDLQDHAAFAKLLGADLLAPDTLAARRETVDPDLLNSFDRLCELWKTQLSGAEEFNQLQTKLSERVQSFAPAIVGGPREAQLDVFSQSLLLQHRVPFGAEEKLVITGDPCPSCGMGFVPPHLNSVLKLLGP